MSHACYEICKGLPHLQFNSPENEPPPPGPRPDVAPIEETGETPTPEIIDTAEAGDTTESVSPALEERKKLIQDYLEKYSRQRACMHQYLQAHIEASSHNSAL